MSIVGRLNIVTDFVTFFQQILAGEAIQNCSNPSTATGVAVNVIGFIDPIDSIEIPLFANTAAVSAVDGTFTVKDLPSAVKLDRVAVNITHGGNHIYRSGFFPPSGLEKHLNIVVFEPSAELTKGANVMAGTVSQALASADLPPDSHLQARHDGVLGVDGSKSGADIDFGVRLVPDNTPNLGVFLNLALHNWNIQVGWPADVCHTADGILNSVKSGLQSADSNVNGLVVKDLTNFLGGLSFIKGAANAKKVLERVSVQFVEVLPPPGGKTVTWLLSDTTLQVPVFGFMVAIGAPRTF